MNENPSGKGSGNPSINPSRNPSINPSTNSYPNPWDNPSNWQQEPFTDPFGKPIGEPMPHTKHLTPSNHQPSPWQPSTQNRHLSRREREERNLSSKTETERTMLDRLNRKYGTFNGNGHRYSRAEHVKISTGFDAARICDYMSIDLWNGYGKNAGPKLHGHEVKVSRSDWLTELRDPTKAEAFAQYCDYWWLVASDAAIVKDGELPKGWGLMAVRGNGLTVIKQATRRPNPAPLGRPLQATLTRAVTKTAVRLAHTEDGAINQIRQRAKIERPKSPAQVLREASAAYPLETAYGGAEHAVLWLKERADEMQAK